MIVWSNAGLVSKLQREKDWFLTLFAMLFVNDLDPDADTVFGDLTEATFSGYSRVPLEDWGDAGLVSSGLARIEHDIIHFDWDETGSPQDIYGYAVIDVDENLVWSERYPSAPYVLSSTQPIFFVQPRQDAKSITS